MSAARLLPRKTFTRMPRSVKGCLIGAEYAGVAQLVEQLTCNQPVGGSTPLASSIFCLLYTVFVDNSQVRQHNSRPF